MGIAPSVAINSLGSWFEADGRRSPSSIVGGLPMPKKASSRNLRGSELSAATAERYSAGKMSTSTTVSLWAKKQDKLGRRSQRVRKQLTQTKMKAVAEKFHTQKIHTQ
jgi:hypothetical protein